MRNSVDADTVASVIRDFSSDRVGQNPRRGRPGHADPMPAVALNDVGLRIPVASGSGKADSDSRTVMDVNTVPAVGLYLIVDDPGLAVPVHLDSVACRALDCRNRRQHDPKRYGQRDPGEQKQRSPDHQQYDSGQSQQWDSRW